MRTAKLVLDMKEPDRFHELCWKLGLIQQNETESPLVAQHFEFHEYASIEIEVDENLNIIGGRFLPVVRS